MAEQGDLRVGTVVVNVSDMERAAVFWQAALGYTVRDGTLKPGFNVLVDPVGSGVSVSLQQTDQEPLRPVRVHLDLYTTEQQRHVHRLVELGATLADDWPYPDDPDFVVLRDPDGNEFCIIDETRG
jgi:catechol 2,3-dioxygenase-like lactoylglutathione lyase family enzyme